jgi:protein-disulfide isomerase
MRLFHALLAACCVPSVFGCGTSAAHADSSGARAAATTAATAASASPAPLSADSILARADRSRIMGDPNAKVWVVVMSDFECPYCKAAHDLVHDSLRTRYVKTGKVRIAYVNFPIPEHPHAWLTAELGLCAGLQGKFWEFHDALFATQNTWNKLPPATTYFYALADSVGLDRTQLATCYTQHRTRPLVQTDQQRGVQAGVQSTPTYLVGQSHRFAGLESWTALRDAIDAELKAAGGAP